MIISVDFDGVCVRPVWPHEPETMPGAVEGIKALLEAGHAVIIWTCRSRHTGWGPFSHIGFVYRWLSHHGLQDRVYVNTNHPRALAEFEGQESRKIFADIYIDDKNLFGFPGWEATMTEIDRVSKERTS